MVEPRFETTGIAPWSYAYAANIARRHLTTGQKAMFGQAMLEAEKVKAKERQLASLKQNQPLVGTKYIVPMPEPSTVPATLPEPEETGDSRDKVAVAVGVSGKSIDKATKIVEQSPELAEKVKSGEMELEPAYREAKASPAGRTTRKSESRWKHDPRQHQPKGTHAMPNDEQFEYNPPFFCESCQNTFALGGQVQLANGSALPVCDLCWNQLTIGQRVKITSDIKHQRDMRELVETLGGWLNLAERLYPAGDETGEEAGNADWLN